MKSTAVDFAARGAPGAECRAAPGAFFRAPPRNLDATARRPIGPHPRERRNIPGSKP